MADTTRHSMLLHLVLLLTFTVGAYSEVFNRGRNRVQLPKDIGRGVEQSSARVIEEGKLTPSIFGIPDQQLAADGEEWCKVGGIKNFVLCEGEGLKEVPQNLNGTFTILSFKQTGIRTLPDGVFEIYSNLTIIGFSKNELSCISKNAFRGLTNLVRLTFQENLLVDARFDFQVPSSLRVVSIMFNQLTKLPRNLLLNTTNLTELDLNHNKIREIEPDILVHLPNLRHLNMENNELTLIGSSELLLMSNLTRLELDNNNLNINASAFVNMHQIEVLSLANCNLTSLDGDAFLDRKSLQTLNLGKNHFICDCHVAWMAEASKQGKPWTSNWDRGLSKVYCGSPKWMSEKLIKHLYPQDLTCDKPEIQPRTSTDVKHEWDTTLILEALMVGGYPYSMWVFPDGSTIKGKLDEQKQNKIYMRSARDSVRNSDHSVIAKLIVQRFDMTGRVNFTLVASNIAGSSYLTFWVNSVVSGAPAPDPAAAVTLLMMLVSTLVITG